MTSTPIGPTYLDLLATPPTVAWRQLRAARHAPPGGAGDGEKREVFVAAMEQAEQFFLAAQSVGPATKPVLLFYGVNQASRSIAAASKSARGDDWLLRGYGHGITTGGMQDLTTTGLASLILKNKSKGTFTELAKVLGFASLPSPTRLGDLWCLIPNMALARLEGMGDDIPLVVRRDDYVVAGARFSIPSQGTVVRASLPGSVGKMDLPEGPAKGDLAEPIEAQRTAATVFLNKYPTLSGWSFLNPVGTPIGMLTSPSTFEVPFRLSTTHTEQEAIDDVATRTFNYQGTAYAFPRVSGSDLATHPLLVWYAILFGLSMLSRYEPRVWAQLIAIDSSQAASPIEAALDEAMRTLPQVILQTMHDVA